jgi:hypothetical protein
MDLLLLNFDACIPFLLLVSFLFFSKKYLKKCVIVLY